MKRSVLITDDEKLIRWSIAQRLRQQGLTTLEAADARECLERAADADAVILDYRLPDRSGFDVLRDLHRAQPSLPVIMLTAHSSVDHAVEAMKLGAFHYIAKPFDVEGLVGVVERALAPEDEEAWSAGITSRAILGTSPAIRDVRRLIARVATSPTSAVLVTGESGTGKDLVARAIHGESRRKDGLFVNLDCASLSQQELESELFGHERGAFAEARVQRIGLAELAHGGTLLLDDIVEMPTQTQSKLLRLIEEKAFRRIGGTAEIHSDVRVIASTRSDLEGAVQSGVFRADLYQRLCVAQIHLPRLGERLEDVPLLIESFVERFAAELERTVAVSPAAIDAARERVWPGNVRELRSAIERAILLIDHPGVIEPDDLKPTPATTEPYSLPKTGVDIVELERTLLTQALERSGGNQRLAGQMLGMNRDQVRYRMAKFGIPSRPRRTRPS